MFSTEPPSVRQLSSSPRANEETANLCFATMAFSSSSFRSFFAAWDTNALGEVLQLVEIPIAVLEVAPVIIGERTLAMLRQLTSFGDEVREDEPLPFVESRETPLDADADVNRRISNESPAFTYCERVLLSVVV